MLRGQYSHTVYPVAGYKFGHKAPRSEKEGGAQEKLNRMRAKYEREGVRRTVEALLLVAQHGHPHVLMLQAGGGGGGGGAGGGGGGFFRLPGGKLKPGEDEGEGLRRKLIAYMSPEDALLTTPWEIGDCVGAWFRPNFDTVLYPYLPPHVTRPKEIRKLFIVPLLERCCFAVPRNYRLVAVPLFELLDAAARFGPVNASIPQMLSRFRLNIVGGPAAAPAPGAQQQQQQPGQQQPGQEQQQQYGGDDAYQQQQMMAQQQQYPVAAGGYA